MNRDMLNCESEQMHRTNEGDNIRTPSQPAFQVSVRTPFLEDDPERIVVDLDFDLAYHAAQALIDSRNKAVRAFGHQMISMVTERSEEQYGS